MNKTLKERNLEAAHKYLNKLRSTPKGLRLLNVKSLYKNAKARAKQRHLEFTLTYEDIDEMLGDICPVFGCKFLFNQGHAVDQSPSLDRRDNTKGYTPENTRVICRLANTLKGSGTLEEFEKILKYMEENLPKNSS